MNLIATLGCVLLVHQIHAVNNSQPKGSDGGVTVGEPLILTSYLKQKKIKEAQEAALVQSNKFLGVKSYAGYFTVDDRFNSNLWFWFFPSIAESVESDPVVLLLDGGPGASSLSGLFSENGPFIVDENRTLSLREDAWNANHSILYIDNPVGTGFSFTNGGLALNQTKIGEDLYSALTQFFQLFPNLQKNDLFIGGIDYAGKYVPAAAYTILKKNPQADVKINLKGIFIGNGWTDPIHQLNYAPFVYNTGLVTAVVADQIANITKDAIQKINEGNYAKALDRWNDIISVINKNSEVNIYNYFESVDAYGDDSAWTDFVTSNEIRNAIHVGNVTFDDKGSAKALDDDQMQSVAPRLEAVLENYRVLIYTGQLDIASGYPMVLEYLDHLNFTGAGEFQKAERTKFLIDWEPVGYARTGGNLVELLVRNAGHFVARDQPSVAREMVFRFTRNLPYV